MRLLHACEYAPPDEFGIIVSRSLAKVRLETYIEYASSLFSGRLYRKNGRTFGGIGLLIGPVGLMWLNIRCAKDHGDRAQKLMNHGFIVLLF